MGRLLIIIGVLFILAGIFITWNNKVPFFGKLPGDLSIERENFRFYFPLTTSILISILLSLVIYFINRWRQ